MDINNTLSLHKNFKLVPPVILHTWTVLQRAYEKQYNKFLADVILQQIFTVHQYEKLARTAIAIHERVCLLPYVRIKNRLYPLACRIFHKFHDSVGTNICGQWQENLGAVRVKYEIMLLQLFFLGAFILLLVTLLTSKGKKTKGDGGGKNGSIPIIIRKFPEPNDIDIAEYFRSKITNKY